MRHLPKTFRDNFTGPAKEPWVASRCVSGPLAGRQLAAPFHVTWMHLVERPDGWYTEIVYGGEPDPRFDRVELREDSFELDFPDGPRTLVGYVWVYVPGEKGGS